MDLLIASGSLSDTSQSAIMAEHAANHASEHDDVGVTLIDPRDLDWQLCDARDWDAYNEDVSRWQDTISTADAYAFCVPVYNWSYAGVFKNMIDLIPPGTFNGDFAGLMGKGGTMKGFLMVQRELRSLMTYFGVETVPESAFASNQHFQDGQLSDSDVRERIEAVIDATIERTRQVG